VEQVSWRPRAFVFHNFLSDEECEHLKALARKRLTKSTVVDNKTGKSMDSTVRTSSGTFLARGEDEVVRAVEKRISLVTMIPEENGEAIQILKYVDGQKYEPHTDYFHDKCGPPGGQGVRGQGSWPARQAAPVSPQPFWRRLLDLTAYCIAALSGHQRTRPPHPAIYHKGEGMKRCCCPPPQVQPAP
jgi:hypothetical protein